MVKATKGKKRGGTSPRNYTLKSRKSRKGSTGIRINEEKIITTYMLKNGLGHDMIIPKGQKTFNVYSDDSKGKEFIVAGNNVVMIGNTDYTA